MAAPHRNQSTHGWRRFAACAALVFAMLLAGVITAAPADAQEDNGHSCASRTAVSNEDDLNAAIACFNEQTPAGDHVIVFSADITMSDLLVDITQDRPSITLTFKGQGHTIEGFAAPGAGLISVMGGGRVTVDSLILNEPSVDGLALYVGESGGVISVVNPPAEFPAAPTSPYGFGDSPVASGPFPADTAADSATASAVPGPKASSREIAHTGSTTEITLSIAMGLFGLGFWLLGTRRRFVEDDVSR